MGLMELDLRIVEPSAPLGSWTAAAVVHRHGMIGDNEFRFRLGCVSQKPDAFRPNRAVELPQL
jgi:hypothetical protein